MSIIYDINNVVSTDSQLATITGKTSQDILPMVGYEDTTPPFFLYFWYPRPAGEEKWYIRKDLVRYSVWDNDAERLIKIQERLINLLNVGDAIQSKIPSTDSRILSSYLIRTDPTGPKEREGWYESRMTFQIQWVTENNPTAGQKAYW